MENKIISKRYAKALLYDIKPDNYDKLLQDLSVLKKVTGKQLVEILSAPIVSKKQKEQMIKELTQNLNLAEKWETFFDLLEKKRRFGLITEIFEELENLIYKSQNKEKIKIYLAHNESDETIKKIVERISAMIDKKAVPEIFIDDTILGGFVVDTEIYHIDGSIHGNLIRLKKLIEQE